MSKQERPINTEVDEIYNLFYPNDQTPVASSIPELKITEFCRNCDWYKAETNGCQIVDSNDQARYALRRWCGWANVNGKRGEMTEEGFKPYKE
ncbi:MAG TPA: hypothetical protein VG895_03450 [Patescibacteria group bacterium]|nr:hypothetical protein [Patescibacteria group bacterium]